MNAIFYRAYISKYGEMNDEIKKSSHKRVDSWRCELYLEQNLHNMRMKRSRVRNKKVYKSLRSVI